MLDPLTNESMKDACINKIARELGLTREQIDMLAKTFDKPVFDYAAQLWRIHGKRNNERN